CRNVKFCRTRFHSDSFAVKRSMSYCRERSLGGDLSSSPSCACSRKEIRTSEISVKRRSTAPKIIIKIRHIRDNKICCDLALGWRVFFVFLVGLRDFFALVSDLHLGAEALIVGVLHDLADAHISQ